MNDSNEPTIPVIQHVRGSRKTFKDWSEKLRWKNPYLDKVTTEGEFIFPFTALDLSIDEKLKIAELQKSFPKIYLELGSGSGAHLIERAKREPNALWFGFELRYKRIFKTASKAKLAGLKNVYLFRTDARQIKRHLPETLFDGIYINFPDPWDRLRWVKNRLLQPETLSAYSSILKKGGFIAFKTDSLPYFEQVLIDLQQDQNFHIVDQTLDLANSEFEAANIQTEFEKLFRSKGLPINYVIAQKVGAKPIK